MLSGQLCKTGVVHETDLKKSYICSRLGKGFTTVKAERRLRKGKFRMRKRPLTIVTVAASVIGREMKLYWNRKKCFF